ncbi:MAG: PBP1A family penicillin-binding protein [Pseudomonadota bacterium]
MSGRRRRRSHLRTGAARRIVGYAAQACGFLFMASIFLFGAAYVVIRDLPSIEAPRAAGEAMGLALIAADGAPIPHRGRYVGAPAALADLPPHLVHAVLAIEDRNFYHHVGVNPLSIARALIINVREGDVRQGGSTITQQLSKNLFLTPERTLRRKLQEAFLSFRLEQRYSKDDILTLYLNRAYFGAGAQGITAAADRYFGKRPADLSLSESATIAGLLKAPTRYAPHEHPEAAHARARLVLTAMVDAGYIDYFSAEAAAARPIRIAGQSAANAPYFVDAARREAAAIIATDGLDDAEVHARTTLRPDFQLALVEGMAAGVLSSGLGASAEVAAVLIERDGAVRAMVGGRDFTASQFNRAIDARRQPGSAFKPFVYLAAIEAGASPTDALSDRPLSIGAWRPSNYNDRYYGDVTLRAALAWSANAATVRLQERIGRSTVREAARRMGVDGHLSSGAALALGVDVISPIELAAAYAPFINGGYRVRPYCIDRLSDPFARILYQRPEPIFDQAASPDAIATMRSMLQDVVTHGTGRAAAIKGASVGGKTGTTQNNRDAWFVGFAGGRVLAVWVGRDDNRPMSNVTGGGAPAVIWREAMSRILAIDGPVAPLIMSARVSAPAVAPLSAPRAPRRKKDVR